MGAGVWAASQMDKRDGPDPSTRPEPWFGLAYFADPRPAGRPLLPTRDPRVGDWRGTAGLRLKTRRSRGTGADPRFRPFTPHLALEVGVLHPRVAEVASTVKLMGGSLAGARFRSFINGLTRKTAVRVVNLCTTRNPRVGGCHRPATRRLPPSADPRPAGRDISTTRPDPNDPLVHLSTDWILACFEHAYL